MPVCFCSLRLPILRQADSRLFAGRCVGGHPRRFVSTGLILMRAHNHRYELPSYDCKMTLRVRHVPFSPTMKSRFKSSTDFIRFSSRILGYSPLSYFFCGRLRKWASAPAPLSMARHAGCVIPRAVLLSGLLLSPETIQAIYCCWPLTVTLESV